MRTFSLICFAGLLVAALSLPASLTAEVTIRCDKHGSDDNDLFRGDNISTNLDDGKLLFTHEDDDETVEMNAEGDLEVNGRAVRLDASERDLVKDYYATFDGIVQDAKEIGLAAGKIGVKGAALGLKAVLGSLLLLSPDYDKDDLEEALDDEGDKLDRSAAKLEKRAKRLERKADKIEKIHKQLRDRVPELDKLGWF